ncbi:hypothetical protein HMPREF1548_01172 [Clostridium sp. KLE 1755]|nr:hypothetical protein HMPREF1548_01172 [Clostridium sp. KLE 1755]
MLEFVSKSVKSINKHGQCSSTASYIFQVIKNFNIILYYLR